jgi:hypothetical protein
MLPNISRLASLDDKKRNLEMFVKLLTGSREQQHQQKTSVFYKRPTQRCEKRGLMSEFSFILPSFPNARFLFCSPKTQRAVV